MEGDVQRRLCVSEEQIVSTPESTYLGGMGWVCVVLRGPVLFRGVYVYQKKKNKPDVVFKESQCFDDTGVVFGDSVCVGK